VAGGGRRRDRLFGRRERAPRQDLGDAPVHDEHLAELAQHDVRRLEVTVDQVPGVGESHRRADLLEHPDPARQVICGRRPGREQFRQSLAVDQLHHEERPPVG
jgi:hypothetical protein